MKNKVMAIMICIFLLSSILLITIPFAAAEKITDKSKVFIFLEPGAAPYNHNISVVEGSITYNWSINDQNNNYSIHFFVEDSNGKLLVEIFGQEISNHTKTIKVKAGKYRFAWRNRGVSGNILLHFNITYNMPSDVGCYTSEIIMSMSTLSIGFLAIGFIKRKKGMI